jgi:MFS family permease
MGRISDRKGRKVLLCIGLLFYSILSLGYVWATNVTLLILIRLLHGVGGAMILPIAMAYVGDISPEGEEGKWMGYANAAFFSGYGIGPLLGGILAERFGINVSFYSMGGFCLLAFLVTLLFVPEISQRKISVGPRLSFRDMSINRTVRGVFSFRLAQTIGRGSLMTFLPIFAATNADMGPSLIGILMAVNMLLMTLLSAPAGRLIADRFNKKGLVIFFSFLYILSLAFIPLANSFWLLLLLCLPRGIGGAISTTASSALMLEEGRKYGMGSAMALMMMAMSIGLVVGPLLGGVIDDLVNINSVFYFGAAAGTIGTILFAWFSK